MKRVRFAVATLVLTTLLGSACTSSETKSNPNTAAGRPAPSGSTTPRNLSAPDDPGSVPSIARREVIRRQEMVRQMDEAAIRASQRMAEDDLEGAVEGYRRAIGQ